MLADALKANCALTSLDLGYNSVGDEGAAALAGLRAVLSRNRGLPGLWVCVAWVVKRSEDEWVRKANDAVGDLALRRAVFRWHLPNM